MQRVPLLALAFATLLPTSVLGGNGGRKPTVRKPAAKEFVRLSRHKIAKVTKLDTAIKPKEPDQHEMLPPKLTAEELEVDKVTIDVDHISVPQVGMSLWAGFVSNWTPALRRSFFLSPQRGSNINFYPLATWADQRDLRVTCSGHQIEGVKIFYGRWSYAKFESEELGSMTLDQDGDSSLRFVVPAASLAD